MDTQLRNAAPNRLKQLLSTSVLALYVVQLMGSCGPVPAQDDTRTLAKASAQLNGATSLTLPASTVVPTEKVDGYATGLTMGRLDVTSDGAATYALPFWVPPGRAGMQPSVGLSYSSRGGNGPVGVGWSLSGYSRISRCAPAMAKAGRRLPVSFTSTDDLCLDGSRLVLVDGTAWAVGARYRTEVDTFSQVTITEADANGPRQFEVRDRGGRILTYGGYGDAAEGSVLEGDRVRLTAAPSSGVSVTYEASRVRYAWAVSRVEDRSGNFMRMMYTLISQDHAVEQLLSKIDYTGALWSPELQPLRSINFLYSGMRQDVQYISGLKIRTSMRLDRVEMWAPTETVAASIQRVRTYDLFYRTDSVSGRSLLAELRECERENVCRRPLTFEWELGKRLNDPGLFEDVDTGVTQMALNGSITYPDPGTPGGIVYNTEARDFWTVQPLDLNGDGRDDILYRYVDRDQNEVRTPEWRFRLATGVGFGPEQRAINLPQSRVGDSLDDLVTVDMDMDGKTDVIGLNRTRTRNNPYGDGHYQLYTFTGSGFTERWSTSEELYDLCCDAVQDVLPPLMHVADLDGDGRPDLLRSRQEHNSDDTARWSYRLNTTSSAGQPAFSASLFLGSGFDRKLSPAGYATDMDGDGAVDVLLREPATYSTADTFEEYFNAVEVAPGACSGGTGSSCPIRTATFLSGLPWGQTQVPSAPPINHYLQRWSLDVNGDGLQDIVSTEKEARVNGAFVPRHLYLSLNTGVGYLPPQEIDIPADAMPGTSQLNRGRYIDNGLRITDFNFDGKQDLVLMDSYGSQSSTGPVQRSKVTVLESTGTGFIPRVLSIDVGVSTGDGGTVDSTLWKGTGYGNRFSRLLDVDGDGLTDMLLVRVSQDLTAYSLHIYRRTGGKPDQLTAVVDANGNRAEVSYKALTDFRTAGSLYTPGTCTYPQYCGALPLQVAEGITTPDGRGGTRRTTFQYADGRHDLPEHRWLGFASRTTRDMSTQQTQKIEMDNVRKVGTLYPWAGLPSVETVSFPLAGGKTLSLQTRREWDWRPGPESRTRFLCPVQEFSTEADSDQGPLRFTSITRDCDAYANVVLDESRIGKSSTDMAPHRHRVETDYSNYTYSWVIGMPLSTVEADTVPADARHPTERSVLRTLRYSYCVQHEYQEVETQQCPWSNRLYRVDIEPNASGPAGADVWSATTVSRDPTGQVTTVKQRGRGGVVKSFATREYDPVERMFPIVDEVFLDGQLAAPPHRTERLYQPSLGVLAIQQDANGVRSEWQYDGFGRLRRQGAPYRTGSQAVASAAHTTVSYGKEQSWTRITVKQDGGGEHVSLLDGFERLVEERERASDGTWSHATREYDALGRLWRQSFPYSEREVPALTVFSYDNAGRLLRQEVGGVVKEWREYEGRNVRIHSAGGERLLVMNARRQISESQELETLGAPQSVVTTSFTYAPFGMVDSVVDAKGNVTTMEYDVLGRRTRIVTPEAGASGTFYDSLGNIREQTNARGHVTIFERDLLGRPVSVQSPEGATRFEWDTAAFGVGALAWSRFGLLPDPGPTDVVLSYGYDALGRSHWETTSVDGGATTYRVDRTYDNYGRPASLLYPQVGAQPRLGVSFDYSGNNGQFTGTRDTLSGVSYWRALERNAAGQVTRELFRNGVSSLSRYDSQGQLRFLETQGSQGLLQRIAYAWNEGGQLRLRNDLLANVEEGFSYDALSRLKTWSVKTGCNNSMTSFDYDSVGNLLHRGVIQQGTDAFAEQQDYRYGEAGARPSALTSMGGEAFAYDETGNQVAWTAPNGDFRQVTYTSFNLPQDLESAQAGHLEFKYDAFQQRVLKLRNNGDSTLYVSGLYEKRQTAGVVSHVFSIPGASGPVAQVQWTEVGGGFNAETVYLHGDHLGSVETVSNQTGGVVQRRKYQPFGAQASPANPTQRVMPTTGSIRMGFTGHEDDAESSLVNMRGRLYDPRAGRFLSVDPFVSAPFSSQGYNRYSYVFNNPLSMTDPSGFTVEGVNGCYGCGGQSGVGLDLTRPAMAIVNWVIDGVAGAVSAIAESLPSSSDVNGAAHKMEDVSDGAGHAISSMANAAWEYEANRSLANRAMWASYPLLTAQSETVFTVADEASAGYSQWGLLGAGMGAVNSQVPIFSTWTAFSNAEDAWYNGNYKDVGFQGVLAVVAGVSVAGNIADGLNLTKLAGVGLLRRTHSIEGGGSSRRVIQMAELIEKEGYKLPPIDVVIHEGEMFVVDGHHRLAAAKMAGLLEVPVNVIRDIASHFSSWKTIEEVVQDAASVGPNSLRVKGQKVGF
ncbi:RHS repeat-associated core domain-containing protein [Corallococcus exercitus]|uniref:ParB N-terminal domain-containing protein n=1 Tax=Corallococcus exercitus TaxID=2316736 RepID=A0A7Y4NFK2_9BACT|nr:RHS repeat-associated core domain-containing protein [Corallococcus exercitus]NOK11035.1 ParB N-terminal domain-containing protein [Corallococcus exercitus]